MSNLSPGRIVREAVKGVLTNTTYGWNAEIDSLREDTDWEDLPRGDTLWKSVSFSRDSSQFFETSIPIDDLIANASVNFPLLTLSTQVATNQNQGRTKSVRFNGIVQVQFAVGLSWRQSKPGNTELRGDLVEHLIAKLFNTPGRYTSVTYNGECIVSRSQVLTGAENWQQAIVAQLTFQVDV